MAMLFGAVFFLSPQKLDKNNCSTDKKYGVTAVLIDASDLLTIEQKAGLESEFLNLANSGGSRSSALLRKGDRLAVYFLSEDGDKPRKVFDMCNPGRIQDRNAVEKATEGELFAKKRWYQFSKKIMNEVEKRISKTTSNQTSPIVETIKYIVSKEFPPANLISNARDYRLIIASDFLQKSSVGSHYRGISNARTVWKKKPTDLGGADVVIWRLNSSKHLKLQNASHTKWWREFFALSKGKLTQVKQF